MNLDVYGHSLAKYGGRVTTKLNVITDNRKIKEMERVLAVEPQLHVSEAPLPNTDHTPTIITKPLETLLTAYNTSLNDTVADITTKFIHLLALGPISLSKIASALNVPQNKLTTFISDYAQPYNPQNSFIKDDTFPVLERATKRRLKRTLTQSEQDSNDSNDDFDEDDVFIPSPSNPHYILKDKTYKELKPWEWSHYSEFERKLIIQNIHHALTRQGYSETHPLRKKICTEAPRVVSDDEKKSSLGGGFLISKKSNNTQTTSNLPFRKAYTDLPKLSNKIEFEPKRPVAKKKLLPVSKNKRKLSSSSPSSSEDEKTKKPKIDSYTSPSSEDMDDEGRNHSTTTTNTTTSITIPEIKSASKRLEYYNSLATKFKFKYKEYETLYNMLKNPNSQSKADSKKSLHKLFELHHSLAQWKKSLWDFDNEVKLKSKIMNLSKHKKTSVKLNERVKLDVGDKSTSPSRVKESTKVSSPLNITSTTQNPSISSPPKRQSLNRTIPALPSSRNKHKISLDY